MKLRMQHCHTILGLLLILAVAAHAEDWPTWSHDLARSGVTSESLPPRLSLEWQFHPKAPPAAGWGDAEQDSIWKLKIPFLQPVRYDDVYHASVVGDSVYFAASAENAIYCIDAARAAVKWVAHTEAPARCSPTVAEGRVYVGADDGCVYCLDAADGRVIWKFKAAPGPDRVLGQGRMMSLWPVRTGVAVDGGMAYFAAGLYPNFGLRLHAVRAADGVPVWTTDSFGSQVVSPQGYLLVDPRRIIVPSGRTFPAVFNRSTGQYQARITVGRCPPNGGAYAALSGDLLFNGTSCITAYDLATTVKDKWGHPLFAPPAWSWFKARAVVAGGDVIYMVTDTDVLAIHRSKTAEACGTATGFETRTQPDYSKCLWRRTEQNLPDALILAGDKLIAGGPGRVAMYDAASGKTLWEAAVEGNARGLAVANGRLVVCTTTGAIYSFGRAADEDLSVGQASSLPFLPNSQAGSLRHGTKPSAARLASEGAGRRIEPVVSAEPYPADSLTRFYAQTAEAILKESRADQGFCLVLGGADKGRPGQLAYELARRSRLNVYMAEPDAGRVAEIRKTIDAAGYYGTRVTVDCGTLHSLSYPRFFANLVICEDAFFGGKIAIPAKDLSKILRPSGGMAFLGQPAGGEAFGKAIDSRNLVDWARGLGASCAAQRAGPWMTIRRGRLPGAADWSHQGANPGNTYCSEDRLVRPPFGLLWFGAPGPHDLPDRHAAAAAPLVTNGRLFIPGVNVLMAFDAYNGQSLWRREVAGFSRERMPMDCSSIAATDECLYVAAKDRCLRLVAATGEEEKRYDLPRRKDGQERRWGWIAVEGNLLLGSRTETAKRFSGWPKPVGNSSECLFAVDVATGRLQWSREEQDIRHNAIALMDGRLFFAASAGNAVKPGLRRIVAWGLASGRTLWEQVQDVSDCVVHPRPGSDDFCGGEIALMCKDNVLLLCGSPFHADHELEAFERGDLSRRSLTALDAKTGRKLWSRAANYQTRPIIVGGTIFAEPWSFDLATGAPKTDEKTGKPFRLFRGSGCGGFSASAGTLFFRKGPLSYFDLEHSQGIEPLVSGQRPSCWISFVPAAGLVLAPEGSVGCTCPYPIQGTVALYPRDAPVDIFPSHD